MGATGIETIGVGMIDPVEGEKTYIRPLFLNVVLTGLGRIRRRLNKRYTIRMDANSIFPTSL
jgi:hypothetical protein